MVKNTIFNQKKMDEFIHKFYDKLVLNQPDKEPVEDWINRLNDNSLVQEKQNYFNFRDIILQRILGYELEDIEFEHAHDDGRPVEFTLLKENKEYVIIEAKGTKTDLDKRYGHKQSAVEQATNYASVREDTKWAVVTNYNEIRLFNPSSREKCITFKFNELIDEKILKEFLLTFSKFSLIEMDIPKKLMNETEIMEKDFEDEFYKLFSETRLMIIKELMYSGIEKIEAIRYSQLILDRFIFICFAEDINLLPAETSTQTILTPIKNKNLLEFTLWDRINELFRFIDIGNPVKDISGFNGGLFNENLRKLEIRDLIEEPDFYDECKKKWKFKENNDEIEKLIINYKDTLNPIYKNLLIMSSFDFESEVDVNILGHIFENSIGDIEELKDQRKKRRKQDGVYYTPEFITDYMCKNTIIPYLSKNGHVNTIDDLIKEYENNIELLDKKIRDIKIIDPACGSGAFLNKAADILLEIHEKIFYLTDREKIDAWYDSTTERRKILLNNIYGVDVNEESVEITKLAMFLKVAKKGMKLPKLDENIKCGNSLINDPEVVGIKAFEWKNAFPEIFEDGGFDIVVGNPPYVNANLLTELLPHEREWLNTSTNYETLYERWDLYIAFIEKGLKILKNQGYLSLIISNSYNTSKASKLSKEFIINNYHLKQLDFFKNMSVFKGVGVESLILTVQNNKNEEYPLRVLHDTEFGNVTLLKSTTDLDKLFRPEIVFEFKKLDDYDLLGDICYVSYGLRPNADEKIAKGEFGKDDLISDIQTEINSKEYVEGKYIKAYQINSIKYLEWNTSRVPSKIARPTFPELYEHPKIIRGTTTGAIYDDKQIICNHSCSVIVPYISLSGVENKSIKGSIKKWTSKTREELELISTEYDLYYILAILNSDMSYSYLNSIRKHRIKNYFYPDDLKKLPIKKIDLNKQKEIGEYAKKITELNYQLFKNTTTFKNWIKKTFNIEKLSQNLEDYYELNFDEFIDEMKKKKVNTKKLETYSILEEGYTSNIQKVKPLIIQINELKIQVNNIIYKIYDLNPDEIKTIEKSIED